MTTSARPASVQVRNLIVSFNRWGKEVTSLDGISFDVSAGSWVALIGHNGSGKSTLLDTIRGATQPQTGEVLLDGRSIQSTGSARLARMVFAIHQNPLLGTAPLLTVLENLRVADGKTSSLRHRELLAEIGLAVRADQPAKVLSGGERQILALLIARQRSPGLLLLDEPLAALDPRRSMLALDLIGEIHHSGSTIIQVTHDLDALVARIDRTISLDHGRIVGAHHADAHPPERVS